MEGCGNPPEVRAFAAAVAAGAKEAGRDVGTVQLVARLNACVGPDGKGARDVLRPRVARTLGAGRLRFATLEAQGLALPEAAKASVAGVPHAAGFASYLPLLPLITDAVVDALTLAGTVDEVTERVGRAGIGQIMIYPFAPPDGSVDDTIRRFGQEVVPAACRALRR